MRSTNRYTPTVERLENILSLSAVHHQPNAMRHKPAPAHVRPHADRSPHEKQISHTGFLIAGSAVSTRTYNDEQSLDINAGGRLRVGKTTLNCGMVITINTDTCYGELTLSDGKDVIIANLAYSAKLSDASYTITGGTGKYEGIAGTGYLRIIPTSDGIYTLGFNPHE